MRIHAALLALLITAVCSAQTWTRVPSGITTALRDVFFFDTAHGWAVGEQNKILATTNGGATWQPQSADITGTTLRSVFFTSVTDGWICGSSGALLKTVDGGAQWEVISANGTVDYNGLWFLSPQVGYIVGGTGLTGTVKRTTNGGTTWTTTSVDRIMTAVHFNASGEGWACGSRGVIHHTADGINWTQQVQPGANQLSDLVCIFMLNDLEGWAGGNPSTIRHTVDGGATWTDQASGTYAGKTGIYFSDAQNGWAITTSPLGGGYPLRRTTDGTTWTVIPDSLSTLHNMRFLNPDFGWAVGDYGTILRYGIGTASVEEVAPTPLRISPNPVTDRLHFTDPVDRAEVFNSTGQLVLRLDGPRTGLDVGSLRPGCYAIRVFAGHGFRTARFVKE